MVKMKAIEKCLTGSASEKKRVLTVVKRGKTKFLELLCSIRQIK